MQCRRPPLSAARDEETIIELIQFFSLVLLRFLLLCMCVCVANLIVASLPPPSISRIRVPDTLSSGRIERHLICVLIQSMCHACDTQSLGDRASL